MEYKFGDDKLEGILCDNDGKLSFQLTDKQRKKTWGPVPFLTMEIHTKPERRNDFFDTYTVEKIETVKSGVHVIVSHTERSVTFGLWVRINDGELSIMQPPIELYERNDILFRLYSINICPELMTVSGQDDVLLPIGSGMTFKPEGKPKAKDRFLIYLEQDRWEICSIIPICGVSSDNGGLVALAKSGAPDMECHVGADGEGNGYTGFGISYRKQWPDPVDLENREIVISPIPEGQSVEVAAGKRLRRHICDDWGKKTLRERCEESPAVKYLTEAYVMKPFHGLENVGVLKKPVENEAITYRNAMTFEECTEHFRQLKEAGIDKVLTQHTGWNSRGHDGFYPTRFPIDERLGGEVGFREMVKVAKDLGFQINLHDNFMMNSPKSPDWDPDMVTHDMYGEPLLHGCWSAGPEYQSWPLALSEERVERHMEKVKDLGIEGMYYMDYMIQPLEVNYHPKHRGPRGDHARGQMKILEAAKKIFGSVGTEFGTFPGVVVADHMAAAGKRKGKAEWPITNFYETEVPVWDIAFSGLIVREDARDLSWNSVMHCILYGNHPRDEWATRREYAQQMTPERIQKQKAVYDLCIQKYGYLQFCEIVDYESDQSYVQTTFDDGTIVKQDLINHKLYVNKEEVVKPEVLEII